MIITIVAIVLGFIMTLGGIAPNIANGALQNRLDTALNHPEHLRVKIHPNAPSYTILGGSVAYTEIDAQEFVLSDLPIESMNIRVDQLALDSSGKKLSQPTQGLVRLRVSEAGVNQFLKSDTFKRVLDEIKKKQQVAAQLDAELDQLSVNFTKDRVHITGQASTMGGFFTLPFSMAGQLRLTTDRLLSVQNVEASTMGRPLAPDMVSAILKQLNPVLDLAKLSDSDMQFYFRELQVHEGYIELLGEARLKKLPT